MCIGGHYIFKYKVLLPGSGEHADDAAAYKFILD